MHNIEGIDRNDDFGDIIEKLGNLKEQINENSEIETIAKTYGVPHEVTNEYINILKDFYASNKIPNGFMDKKLIIQLGFDLGEGELELSNSDGVFLYYIKKLCPNKYKDISLLILTMISNEWIWTTPGRLNIKYGKSSIATKSEASDGQVLKDIMAYIEIHGDSAYDTLKFCSAFDGSYIKNAISNYKPLGGGNEEHSESESRSMITQFFENFVYEAESLNLLNFLKGNPQTLDNLGGKEIKSINLSLDSGINFTFRGIIEMVKSRADIDFPHLKDNATDSDKNIWKGEWEKIIKEYENVLRNYIAKDKIESKNKEKSFDRIFFTMAIGDEVIDSLIPLPNNRIQQFSGNDIIDYSFNQEKDSEKYKIKTSKKMISDIKKYVKEHPNEKILICVEQHGNPDGSSGNGWTKEDWLKLANLSENIKIWSIRCYFGTAFENKDIYNQKASISGFSNLSTGNMTVNEAISGALNKNLGFHEMEIYTRLNYPVSVTPLTENMEYFDRNTGEKKIGKIGLAQNNDGESGDIDNNYA